MKRLFFLLLLAATSMTSQGQSNISLGQPYVVIDAAEKYYFAQGKEIMSVKLEKKAVTIQKFKSDDLSFQKIKMYDDFPKNYSIEKVTKFLDRYYVLYSVYDGDNEQLFSREINFKDGQFTGPGTKIINVAQKVTGDVTMSGFYNYSVTGKFSFFFSSDSSRMLVEYRLKPDVKNDNKSYDVIGMGVFDKTMKNIWNKEVKMPYTEKKMNNLDYVVDRKGNAYISTMVYDDSTTDLKDDEGNPNYTIEILKIPVSGKELMKYPVTLPNKFVRTLWINENPKGFLVCTGFYNQGKDNMNADGILMFKMGDDGKAYDVATYEIPLEILNQYASGKMQRKNERKDGKDKAEFEDLKLREVLFEKDGSMLLVSEQSFMKVHRQYSSTGTSIYYSYHYNDLLVAKINSAGKMDWMKKLPKRQTGGNGRGGMSYKYIRSANDYCFLYLDNVKNKGLALDEVPAMHVDGAGGYLTAYRLDKKTGAIKKDYVLDTRDVNGMEVYQFMPSRIVATTSKEFVFEVYKKKKEDILIKVHF